MPSKPPNGPKLRRTLRRGKAVAEHLQMYKAENGSPGCADAVTGEAAGLSISRFFFL